MSKILEAGDLPEEEKVYLKKDFLGWRVVEPYKNPETNKINWFILLTGGKKNIFVITMILLFLGISYIGVKELIGTYKIIADSPCDYCLSCQEQTSKVLRGLNLNKINTTILTSSSLNGGEEDGGEKNGGDT